MIYGIIPILINRFNLQNYESMVYLTQKKKIDKIFRKSKLWVTVGRKAVHPPKSCGGQASCRRNLEKF